MGGGRGCKTLTEASAKPRKIAEKSLKHWQVAGSDLFSVQVTEKGLKSAPGGPGRSLWAEKCDLKLRVSRRQISRKVVVSVAANVCHLRNRVKNTWK